MKEKLKKNAGKVKEKLWKVISEGLVKEKSPECTGNQMNKLADTHLHHLPEQTLAQDTRSETCPPQATCVFTLV